MIWVLLGLLLFGSGALADLTRPQGRALAMRQNVGSLIADPERRAAAEAIADRTVAESDVAKAAAALLQDRLKILDAADELDEAGYFAAIDDVADAIDASERRLVEMRMELRAQMTAEEWVELAKYLRADEG